MVDTSTQKTNTTTLSDAALYDLYAPAVYGNILQIVPHVPIADKILEKVFRNAFQNRVVLNTSLRAPLTNLLNQSRTKSKDIVLALKIFRECCEGSSASLSEKSYGK